MSASKALPFSRVVGLGTKAFPYARDLKFWAKLPWRRALQWSTDCSSATSPGSAHGRCAGPVAASASARNSSRSFLGTTAGTALFVFSGSLLLWPVADLCLGPQLVLLGMKADPSTTGNLLSSSVTLSVAQDTSISQEACVVVVSGVPGAGKQLEHIASHTGRLVVYVSLREATSSHDLYFALLAGIYSADRLGLLGTLAHSMGVWWITMFDIIVGYEPEKTRAINFSVVMQHLRRALRAAHANQPLGEPRPLVILDHLGEAARHKDDPRMRSMLTHLLKWCTATCYDDGLTDIVICDGPTQAAWRRPFKRGSAQHLRNAEAFADCSRIMWLL